MATATDLLKQLGLERDTRGLIVNVDDFGMCWSTIDTGLRSIEAGVATSCTVMTPCPWGDTALAELGKRPDIPFGVHLTLVSEHPIYRWGPLSPAEEVPSVVDEERRLFREERIPELMERASLDEVEREWRRQIEHVLDRGLKPTHVDSHCNTHERREDIFEMTLRLAREYGLALRVGEPERAARVIARGLPCPDGGALDSFRMETATKQEELLKMLRELPAGVSEWAMHPAHPTGELRAITTSHPVREADETFCLSEEARRIIDEEGIRLMSYRDFQPLWRGGA